MQQLVSEVKRDSYTINETFTDEIPKDYLDGDPKDINRGIAEIIEKPIYLPEVLEHQQSIYLLPMRYKVIVAGRRWGKTLLGLMAALDGHGPIDPATGIRQYKGAVDGGNIIWVAPTYRVAVVIWRLLKRATRHATARRSEIEKSVELYGGGIVTIRSAEDPDALRGDGYDGAIIDEAAYIKKEAWTFALRPALADKQGWALFITSPNGKDNWIYDLYNQAKRLPNWGSWQRPTSDNPKVPNRELLEIRQEIGDAAYSQEFDAEFLDTISSIFKMDKFRYWEFHKVNKNAEVEYVELRIRGQAGGLEQSELISSTEWVRFQTVDLAASLKTTADYTVISTWWYNKENSYLILRDVYRQRINPAEHLDLLVAQYALHSPANIFIEQTAYQIALVQQAAKAGLPVIGVHVDKDKLTRALPAVAKINNGKVFFPADCEPFVDCERELRQFPSSVHDDFVDTLSLAVASIDQITGKTKARVRNL